MKQLTKEQEEFLLEMSKDKYAFGATIGSACQTTVQMGQAPDGVLNDEYCDNLVIGFMDAKRRWKEKAEEIRKARLSEESKKQSSEEYEVEF